MANTEYALAQLLEERREFAERRRLAGRGKPEPALLDGKLQQLLADAHRANKALQKALQADVAAGCDFLRSTSTNADAATAHFYLVQTIGSVNSAIASMLSPFDGCKAVEHG